MSDEQTLELSLERVGDYEFRVRFDGTAVPDLATDESAPLGHDAGPNPSRLLAAAVANCLCASLLFALRKFKNEPQGLSAKALATMQRNEHGRWRIVHIGVDLQLADAAAALEHVERAMAQFEDFCIVTESVRQGIRVAVSVHDADGVLLHVGEA
ncbi:MAG: peroxiredoxin [Rhodanobacter sp. 68-29]|uniref:OsmC family protein n=1 Tax=Rhodanobacter sp. PCA2 TaxID=2006117 RepID=UPI00086BD2CF|nr:OsmC family protein [Rhodanobacter sp. PCA2]MBA2077401.1 peroxiredoxin [Rhodanobacter sp. PCA2]MBN8923534.1 OsmC family protein [Rhodanobacter sp.]ODU75111.1 MAG: peroxiredoxin [Rhodanobacter sp. SCN 69-32]OJY55389.1 MAG: peroxiredoxin [Rhodanobacter sp. 68-29]